MADDKDKAEAAPLTDTQRIDQLESSVKFHRMLVIVLGAMTVILLTMVITAIFVLPGKSKQSGDGASSQQVTEINSSLQEEVKNIRKLEEGLSRMEEVQAAYVETMDRMGVIDRTNQTEAMLAILLQQHADYRDIVRVLKSGMSDLARMVPGSRTWLQEYTERLNQGLNAASKREKQLLEFQESLEEPEPEKPAS